MNGGSFREQKMAAAAESEEGGRGDKVTVHIWLNKGVGMKRYSINLTESQQPKCDQSLFGQIKIPVVHT